MKCGNYPKICNVNNLTLYGQYYKDYSNAVLKDIKKLTLHNCSKYREFEFQNIDKIVLKNCNDEFEVKIKKTGIKYTVINALIKTKD